jgi:hypothetical protein
VFFGVIYLFVFCANILIFGQTQALYFIAFWSNLSINALLKKFPTGGWDVRQFKTILARHISGWLDFKLYCPASAGSGETKRPASGGCQCRIGKNRQGCASG